MFVHSNQAMARQARLAEEAAAFLTLYRALAYLQVTENFLQSFDSGVEYA